MTQLTRMGIDLATHVFQLHGVDERGHTVLCRRLSRTPLRPFCVQLRPCLVGLEGCGSAHDWARELRALGHDVRRIAPQFVALYWKNDKHDGNEAAAICEAVGRPPPMRVVPVKEVEPQAVLPVHRTRPLLGAARTALLETPELPVVAREVFTDLAARLRMVDARIAADACRVAQLARQTEPTQRLLHVPGMGPVIATALGATVGDAHAFTTGRQLAAWWGLVSRQHSRGGTRRLGRITTRGDVYLRTLLSHGARAVMRQVARRADATSRGVTALTARRGVNTAVVALAAKQARIL